MLHVLIFVANNFLPVKFTVGIATSSWWSWHDSCLVSAAMTCALPGLAHLELTSARRKGESHTATSPHLPGPNLRKDGALVN